MWSKKNTLKFCNASDICRQQWGNTYKGEALGILSALRQKEIGWWEAKCRGFESIVENQNHFDFQGPQRINLKHFCDSLTFPLVTPTVVLFEAQKQLSIGSRYIKSDAEPSSWVWHKKKAKSKQILLKPDYDVQWLYLRIKYRLNTRDFPIDNKRVLHVHPSQG